MKALKISPSHSLIIGTETPIKIESNDSDKFVKTFNKMADGIEGIKEYDEKDYIKEVEDLINNIKNSQENQHSSHHQIYYTKLIKETSIDSDEEIILKSNRYKIVHFSKYGIEDILEKFLDIISTENTIFIIELFDDVIITGASEHSNCLQCVLKRYIENHNHQFKFEGNTKVGENTVMSSELMNQVRNISEYKLKTSSCDITLIEKNLNSFNDYNLLPLESCISNNVKKEQIKLRDDSSSNCSNYRVSTDLDVLKKMKKLLGRFSICFNLLEKNKDGIYIYQVESSSDVESLDYSLHGGKGLNREEAIISTLGEAIERYSSRYHGDEEVVNGTYLELKKDNEVLNPKRLTIDRNLKHRYSENVEYEWVLGKSLVNSKDILVPANSVYLPYKINAARDYISQSSTGLACGLTEAEAILSGLLESIERDAYTIYHKNTINYRNIGIEKKDINETLEMLLEEKKLEPILQYLKTDVEAIVVHCTLVDKQSNYPIYTHGSSCALDIKSAVESAILEALQLRESQKDLLSSTSLDDEYLPYIEWGKGNKSYVAPFLETKPREMTFEDFTDYRRGSIESNIEAIVRSLYINGYESYFCNLTREETGFKVVRVLIPGFQDIDNYEDRLSDRVFTVPGKIGLEKKYKNLNNKYMFS